MRISHKLEQSHKENDIPTFSFEFFVPKTSQGVQNLYDRMDRMYNVNPQFIDVTWNAGGRLSNLTTDIVQTAQSVLGLETCMHLTCTNMPVDLIDKALKEAYDSGCQNILALRGDPPVEGGEWTAVEGGFQHAKDLVKYIRNKYGNHFDIGVAAYPEGHPEETDIDLLIGFLKEKIDAGADFIITQMFYDAENFIEWCQKLRDQDINVPIIPGIMPISTYASFKRRSTWCEIKVPEEFENKLLANKDDDQLVRKIGTELVAEMCSKLINSGFVKHLHFYTMNLEKSSIMVLEKLGLINSNEQTQNNTEALPWRKSLNPNRNSETVRPIFWKNRKYSYITRTQDWDEFPNGRWGDPNSAAFGDVELFTSGLLRQSSKRCIELWGEPKNFKDVSQLVVKYLQGEVNSLPWSDTPITAEIDSIKNELIEINQNGILTINSQPRVNGEPSNHPAFGWGPKDGFVYQKQYLEFLMPKSKILKLISKIELINKPFNLSTNQKDNFNYLTYFAIDFNDDLITNSKDDSANAVTWGIFPGQEVLQPTIVEKVSFLAWKDEVFRIAEEWSGIFEDGSDSKNTIKTIINDYALVNIVDNDYVGESKIFDLLKQL
ncbi:methylenetetrahydrofolate reductase (NADPH) [Wickerhamomyces ciferrii]|uniref:Methylenetetrahydrofolate reductase (NADPH) n=1 Tax=Wickerhamomyces ciferrii (strain ATCC 14091 / BCRC 22168 / CBS 111 / JCM 3599 / NBRC 0793 / NRRL Y-1031 F-60-10) TaxID=1206466 RepID=K0KJW6_WICCF|nr:methylenetetrahydrofolate reductase (NADPH) [Wickerhamomyces ciferrii]CCH41408.1 methylenetetrahydrofolate reductase (NADPH) [Wickerhamomyces ciferrii]